MSLEFFHEKVTEGFLAKSGTEIQLKVRLTGQLKEFQGHRLDWRGSLSTHVLWAERSRRQTGKTVKRCTTTYSRKCDIGLCIEKCFEVCHSKLNYWE
jgi:hypothetical protein